MFTRARAPFTVVLTVATILGLMQGGAMGQSRASGCDINADALGDLPIGVPGEGVRGTANAGAVHVFTEHTDTAFTQGMDTALAPSGNNLWHQGNPGVLSTPERGERFGVATACADFDGDGYDDLAVGVPGETVDAGQAGGVHVFYGSRSGLTTRDQLWHQDTRGMKGAAEHGDRFGAALASDDFDRDGFHDLAVGVPGEDVDGAPNAGAVHVLYGSAHGVSARDDLWHQDDRGVKGSAERGDRFGAALAAGHVDDDRYPDLAVGVPRESVNGVSEAGAVHFLLADSQGLTAHDDLWHQGRSNTPGRLEREAHVGAAIAIAELDDDRGGEVVVGIPDQDLGGVRDGGMVHVMYGGEESALQTGAGVHHQSLVLLHQGPLAGDPEPGDHFGAALNVGDFDGDGFVDLAVGVVGEGIRGRRNAGAVQVVYGGGGGLTRRDQLWHQADTGVDGAPERDDAFGFDVFVGDLDGDGIDDLVVGVPGEGVKGVARAGAAQTFYGSTQFLTSRGGLWHQGDAGVASRPERGDAMGSSLP